MSEKHDLHRASEEWIQTIDEEKGYSNIDAESFRTILRRMHAYQFCRDLLRCVEPGERALEAGCGWATSSFFLAEKGVHVTAIDISEKLIQNLRAIQAQLGGCYASRLALKGGDIFKLHAVGGTFDVVFSDGTYEHFLDAKDREEILRNASDVLNENGRIAIAVPNLNNPFFDSVVDPKMPPMCTFTPKSLALELEAGGFEVLKTGCTFVNPGFDQWVKHRWMVMPIRGANVVFRCLPQPMKRVFAAHFYCIARKK